MSRPTLQAIADLLELGLFGLELLLELGDLLPVRLDRLAAVLDGRECLGLDVSVVRDDLGELLLLPDKVLLLLLEADVLLANLLGVLDKLLREDLDFLVVCRLLIVCLLELLDFRQVVRVPLLLLGELGRELIHRLCGDVNVLAQRLYVVLPQQGFLACKLIRVPEVRLGLALLVLKRGLLALHNAQAVHLLAAVLVQLVDLERCLLDRRLIPRRTDNVLEVLEKTVLVLVLRLGLHESDRLDLTLKNEETVVVEINALALEERRDLGERRGAVVNRVL